MDCNLFSSIVILCFILLIILLVINSKSIIKLVEEPFSLKND